MNKNKIKYIFIVLQLIAGSVPALGQLKNFNNLSHFDDRKLHFGFYLGINTMDYRISNYNTVYENPVVMNQIEQNNPEFSATRLSEIYQGKSTIVAEVYQIMPGFTVGGVINYRLTRDLDFRFTPGMSLGNRHFTYFTKIDPKLYAGLEEDAYLSTPSAYVDLPLGIRYKGFRHNNLRPYIYLGAAYRHDLESKSKSENVVHLQRTGEYAEVALGLDSYLEYFRFTAEVRFSYGLNNLIRHDWNSENIPYYGYNFKALKSNIFTLIFYFE